MLLENLGVAHPLYEKYYEDAMSSYNAAFFSVEHLSNLADEGELEEENKKQIIEFLYAADENVKKFMWLYYYIQFKTDEDFHINIWQMDNWPLPKNWEEKFPGMIKACVYLAAADNLREWINERKISDASFKAFYGRYKYLADLNTVSYNTYGLIKLAPFLYMYAKPFGLAIGRLTYQITEFNDFCELYENDNGERIFVATKAKKYDEEGHIANEGFSPVYEQNSSVLKAHTFNDMGLLNKEPIEIDLNVYKKILSPKDKVATIHIPAGPKLTTELVYQSLKDAKKILNENFSGIKAFVCKTWFIDMGIRDMLNDGSNMKNFAELFDVISADDNKNHSIFEHIFVVKPQPLENLVPKNDFQKRFLDRALRGEKLYWGYGVLKNSIEL